MNTKLSAYDYLLRRLKNEQHTWLITGVAGFIGSNLLEALLMLDQKVVGLDNFSTGYQKNLDEVCSLVGGERWSRFGFIEGDIRNIDDCNFACQQRYAKSSLHCPHLESDRESIHRHLTWKSIGAD